MQNGTIYDETGLIEQFVCPQCNKTVNLKALIEKSALHPEWPERKLAIANHDKNVSLCSYECDELFRASYS
jgi:hypothetical protein